MILKKEWPLFLFTKSFSKATKSLYLLGLDNSLFHRVQQKKINMLGSEHRHFSFSYLVFMFYFLVAQLVKSPPTMWETWVRSLIRKMLWRRKWQPTPVLLPGKSHGQRSLVGYSPWGHKESDMTERLHFHFHNLI